MSKKAVLEVDGKKYDLPVTVGSENEVGIDISGLRGASGAITVDEGYGNTGACKSAITFVDGERGILRYRGYPIEQLAEQSSFLEVSFLLVYGHLPSQDELQRFQNRLTRHSLLHEDMRRFFEAFPPDAHPMAIAMAVVSGLSTFYQDSLDVFHTEKVDITIHRLIAKFPTIAAFAFRKSRGQPLMYPDNSLRYAANFLRMMFGFPTEAYAVDPELAHALDVLLILHADHEQNCSTSTVRMVGSAQANLYISCAAGLAALAGPLHGGANQSVLEMLEGIRVDGGNVKTFIAKVKDKNSEARLMGFGHRVYKNHDPRASIIKRHCDRVLAKLGIKEPLLQLAKELEEAALADDYFKERRLYPNVDFYSGIIYKAMGFPVNMFTVMFAMGRLPGWIAQWKEMVEARTRIGRPRQIYIGETRRDYVPIEKR